MYTKSIAIQALLSSEVSAVLLQYRPPAGTVPWQIPVTTPEFENPGFPHNYPVPDFGVDQDIKNVSGAIAQSEKKLKKTLHATFGQTAPPVATPRNYVVPDFGVDHDVLATKSSIKQSETALGKTLKADFSQKDSNVATPRNYFVPDFGVDQDIKNVSGAIAQSEKKLSHKLAADFSQKDSNVATPRNYSVPDFGVDRDVKWTENSIKTAETSVGHKWKPVFNGFWQNMPATDANSSYVFNNSSPEFSSATKVNGNFAQTSDPMPAVDANSSYVFSNSSPEHSNATKVNGNYAQTSEIPAVDANSSYVFSNSSPEQSSATKTNGSTAFKAAAQTSDPMPAVDANSSYVFNNSSPEYSSATKVNGNYAQTEEPVIDGSNVQLFSETGIELQSDPVCNSFKCTQYLFPKDKKDDYPMDYFVPNFGLDHDIKATNIDLKVAEKQLNEKFVWHSAEDKKQIELEQKIAKQENSYNMNPELDSDIVASQTDMKIAEKNLSHQLSPTYQPALIQLKDDPACSSAGCPKQEYVEKEQAKIVQYPVDVPLAEDVSQSLKSEEQASDQLAHNWKIPAWR